MNLASFLSLTFAISLAGFACVYLLPAARSPESATGLPFWLLMVWGPSLAALVLSWRDGQVMDLLARTVTLSNIPWTAWLLVILPLILLAVLRPWAPGPATPVSAGLLAAMIAFNLILGPLGEELGWRGYLQDRLMLRMGWLEASVLVGAIWAIWHLPLWAIDSPHAQIALPLFLAHVMCYAVLIGAAYTLSAGSLLPAILLHLTVNLSANLAVFAGFRDPNAWFATSLPFYALLSGLAIGIVVLRTGQIGLRALDF